MISNKNNNHKFKVPSNICALLTENEIFILTHLGIPAKILSNTFNYLEVVELDGNNIVLGQSSHVNNWKLVINADSKNILLEGKGLNTGFQRSFFNSSLESLVDCIDTYYFYMSKLIQDDLLGDYQLNHENYAKILKYYIDKIDSKAVNEGIWFAIIDDIDVGIL